MSIWLRILDCSPQRESTYIWSHVSFPGINNLGTFMTYFEALLQCVPLYWPANKRGVRQDKAWWIIGGMNTDLIIWLLVNVSYWKTCMSADERANQGERSQGTLSDMVKEKPNSTRTYDGDGFRRRAACLCFNDETEAEVRHTYWCARSVQCLAEIRQPNQTIIIFMYI